MFWIFLIVISAVLLLRPATPNIVKTSASKLIAWRFFWAFSILIGLFNTSCVVVGANKVGHLTRIYLGSEMPPGRVIALPGENGPQAEILSPGFHFRPFIKVLYDVDTNADMVEIPPGSYGEITAVDGKPLDKTEFLAKGWPEAEYEKMLDAEYFLTHGGQKGPQLTVLRPGKYRLNLMLFKVEVKPALDVLAGEVAVIKSNVQEITDCPAPDLGGDKENGSALTVPLVKKGCIGIWDEPLLPNRYYLNLRAYSATKVSTRALTWFYQGGYTTRRIDLTVNNDGKIEQKESEPFDVPVPEAAADSAIMLTVEGWRVPIEVRALVQVEPKNAPRVVASVGGINEVEDKIITPVIRSVLRNETGKIDDPSTGTKGWHVKDLLTKRTELESVVEQAVIPEGAKAGVTIKEIRFGDPVIPPELLIAEQRSQLAQQLKETFIQEKLAQAERVNAEKAKATADQQADLVKAEIAVQVAEQTKAKLQREGEGEKLRLMEIAAGQKAQTAVLGEERVLQLSMLKEIIAAAVHNPEIIKVPSVLVQGDKGNSLTGAAAVLGASNLTNLMSMQKTVIEPKTANRD